MLTSPSVCTSTEAISPGLTSTTLPNRGLYENVPNSPHPLLAPHVDTMRSFAMKLTCLSPSDFESNEINDTLQGKPHVYAQISAVALSEASTHKEIVRTFLTPSPCLRGAPAAHRILERAQRALADIRGEAHQSSKPNGPSFGERAIAVLSSIPDDLMHSLLCAHAARFRTLSDYFYDCMFSELQREALGALERAATRKILPISSERVLATLIPAGVQIVDDFFAFPFDGAASLRSNSIQLRAGALHEPHLRHVVIHESLHLLAGVELAVQETYDAPEILRSGLHVESRHPGETFEWLNESTIELMSAKVLESSPEGYPVETEVLRLLMESGACPLEEALFFDAFFENGDHTAHNSAFHRMVTAVERAHSRRVLGTTQYDADPLKIARIERSLQNDDLSPAEIAAS